MWAYSERTLARAIHLGRNALPISKASSAIVRNAPDGVRELMLARWGMPSSNEALFEAAKKRARKLEAKGEPVDFAQLLRMEPRHWLNEYPQHRFKTLEALARS
jgi:hypothetical protein